MAVPRTLNEIFFNGLDRFGQQAGRVARQA